ncbi:hypothetical protein ACNKHO_17555 [Shigella flexneri]
MKCLAATQRCPAIHEIFRGGGFSSRFLTEGGAPFTMTRANIIKGLAGPSDCRRRSVALPKEMHDNLMREPLHLAYDLLRTASDRQGPFTDVYGDGELGG